ncbi:NirA family protein [Pedosphaera parvula]|uniref:Precorrin-3B synthase n=1 Tax=Pedosphaera parvula (strain Ellin514) TaxID=320771 RepID=B9XJ64_PEDPL|nr:NirA family protein [Pedosphaera parvula]EEF60102.1 precorrin-3B synthase [Pedosphaera parvula Ellin514]
MNTPTLPFEEIKGQKLSDEQRSYLEGLFAGLANRGFKFTDVATNPITTISQPTALEGLIFEERIKHELHPLESFPLLLEHAAANKAPERENIFRFKWNGLFYLTPNKEAFMARLRIPAGQLKTFQWREIAHVANELTTKYVQITTRSNLQIRLIEMKDAPEVLRRIQSVGLHTRGSGADNIRNLTANPTFGIDPHELIDTGPLCHQLGQIILNDRQFYDLPRKFNVAFDGGGLIGTVEDTNDIGVKAVNVPSKQGNLEAGIYFRIKLGGATGHKAFAKDLGVLVRPEEILKVIVAVIRVYIAHGNRTDRKKARLKHLLEQWTLEQYLAETEKLLGYQLFKAPLEADGNSSVHTEHKLPIVSHSHIGVFPQKQSGLNYIGVALPVGQITPKQMLRLADIADNYASGEIRLTVWQNLIIPNIPDAFVETVKKALVKMGLHWQQSNIRSGLVACTGNSYCKFAASNTKAHGLELANYLEKRFKLDQPINIHLTGCPNSCAQHYMGDIGLLGAKVKMGGASVDGYHVFVGGGFGDNQSVGRQVFQGVSFEQLSSTLEKMLEGYLRHRQVGESFQKFTARHDLNTLQAIFSNEE